MLSRSSSILASVLYLSTNGTALAQTPDTLTDTALPETTLPEVVVTGNLLNEADLIRPTVQYAGTKLKIRAQTTVGETLNSTLGVSSSYFGPNSSRPIIRGLDGDRIRILGNGGATLDASGLSYDHAVPVDPLTVERIDILRGPASLLYGGTAVGGVVNLIDNRIPRTALFDAIGGITGKADAQLGSANKEKSAAISLDTGNHRYALHADAFNRSTKDLAVPIHLPCTQAGTTTHAKRLCNSASDVQGGALGGSVFFNQGYLGVSTSTYRNTYGTVAEDEVSIRMRSEQHAIEGELKDIYALGGFIHSIKGQFSATDYTHTERDAGEPQTTFNNKGNHLRLEARHAKFGRLNGVIGLESENNRFSADGAEAFAPYSKTRHTGLFAYEELGLPWGRLSFGGRLESASVNSLGNANIPRFFSADRRFTPKNYALGALINLTPTWQATSNLSWNQRTPKDYELYANGPHAATGAYEVGNHLFDVEKSTNLDAGLQWKSGAHQFNVNVFTNQFDNYIALESTGMNRDSDGNGHLTGVADCGDGTSVESGCNAEVLPEFAYRSVKARFTGVEIGSTLRLLERPSSTLNMELRADIVRAKNKNSGDHLSRISPARVGASLIWTKDAWSSRIGFEHTATQRRIPIGELATAGYTLWNTAVTYRMKASGSNLLWFAKLDNLGNKLAYSPTSILTQIAPGKTPLSGRTVKLGVQINF